MKVYLNNISGIDDAIVSLLMSKRTWTPEKENEIRTLVRESTNFNGTPIFNLSFSESELKDYEMDKNVCHSEFGKWLLKLAKWGSKHITILRFIDMSITVEGLHRAGQDDWDSHASRFSNRIVRSSTRLSSFGYEMSDFYKDKIIPTDNAMEILGISALLPDQFVHNSKTYVKTINGYVDDHYKNDKDVLRGLYMLSIPSNFIFKINLTEWAHVFKMRNESTSANQEVKELCEAIENSIEKYYPLFNRDFFNKIVN